MSFKERVKEQELKSLFNSVYFTSISVVISIIGIRPLLTLQIVIIVPIYLISYEFVVYNMSLLLLMSR